MQWNEFQSQLRHVPTRQLSRIRQAFELGQKMHADQKRKSGEPYFNHPIAVAHMLADMGADPDTIIAALLHDTVEDTPLTLEELEAAFGPVVHTLIEGVTKLSESDMRGAPNMDAQIETLRKMFTLMQQDIRIMVIKLVDRLHNMQTISFLPPEKQQGLAKETMEVYVKIADRLCMQDLRDELEALCLGVLQPELQEKMVALRVQNEARGQSILREMIDRLEAHFPEHDASVHTHFEHKSWENLKEQLNADGTTVTGISAVTAVFVCTDVDVCYRVLGALHQMWKRESMSFQDFINSPTINGYRGLHTTIILEDGTRVRCKIRTQLMQEYARKGVTTLCFRPDARELNTWLPWTERISSLTEDTQGRSQEFWESLQSDILGESITIYGPGDQSVQVPKGSTALDGAFYLCGKEALRLSSINIAGKETSLDTPVQHSMSLNVSLNDEPTVQREWLEYAHTGYATAIIRYALVSGRSDEEKIPIGKDLLQQVLTRHKQGYLEELDEKRLNEDTMHAGFASTREMFINIADGHADPEQIYQVLFAPKSSKTTKEGAGRCIVRFSIERKDIQKLRALLNLYEKHNLQISNVRLSPLGQPNYTTFSIVASLSPAEQRDIQKDLELMGALHIEIIPRTRREVFLLLSVIILWSINPVAAKWLLIHDLTPLNLMTIRFLTFFAYTLVFFGIWRALTKQKFSKIPHLTFLALLPTLGNAGMSLYYFALATLPPSMHLTILRFNTLILPSGNMRRFMRIRFELFLLGLMLITVAGFFVFDPSLGPGIAFSVITMLFYTFYSLTTEHTLQQHKINTRYPYLLLQIGVLSGFLGLALLPLQAIADVWNSMTLPAVIYVLLCVCLSHTFYSALLKTARFKHFTDLLLLEVPLAMALEATVLGIVLPPLTYLVMGLILLVLFLLRVWTRRDGLR